MADLLGADPRGVVFGRSMTQLTYDLARTLARTWSPGDEVVVTRLDHDANIRPWVQAAEAVGATVRWVGVRPRRPASCDRGRRRPSCSERTRLVAVTGASNLLGTRPDLPAIADLVHAPGALLYVDGVHLTAHAPVDVAALGADFFVCSPYKFFGPHCGVLAARPRTARDAAPGQAAAVHATPCPSGSSSAPCRTSCWPGRPRRSTSSPASSPQATGTRRERVLASMAVVEAHEDELLGDLESRLAALDGVVLHGRAAERTPTVLFTVPGRDPARVSTALAEVGVNAPSGSFYAIEAARWMGLGASGGIRAGIAPYTDAGDVDRLVDAVRSTLNGGCTLDGGRRA